MLVHFGEVDAGEVGDGGEFLAQVFDEVGDVGALGHFHVVRQGGGHELVVDADEAGEGHGSQAEGAHGFVDLGHVPATNAVIVGELHEGFDVLDQFVQVEELGTLERGGVLEAAAVDVETVLEGVEVAGLGAALAPGRGRGRGERRERRIDPSVFEAVVCEGVGVVALGVGEDGFEVGEEFLARRLTGGTKGEGLDGIGFEQGTRDEEITAEGAQLVVGERGAGVGILGGGVGGRDGGFWHDGSWGRVENG